MLAATPPVTIYDFHADVDIRNWIIVDDVVMGGRSSGSINLTADGHGAFEGDVSLANNGGFSSVRFRPAGINVGVHNKVVIRLRGDGKRYQFRLKSNTRDYHSYLAHFDTNGEWQEIEIELSDMYPAFRGRKLSIPNFSHEDIAEVAFLIGNKKEEEFRLLIDWIVLR